MSLKKHSRRRVAPRPQLPALAEKLAEAMFYEIARMEDEEARRLLLLELVFRAHGHLEAAG